MNQYVVSCATPRSLTDEFVKEITSFLTSSQLTINKLDKFSHNQAMDIFVTASSQIDHDTFKIKLMEISNRYQIDMAILNDDIYRTSKRLIVFDMDSTLIQHEVIDEMAAVHGIGDKVKHITERAMNGELNFDEALRERVALLKGLPRDKMEEIYGRLKLSPGVEDFMNTVKALNYKTAIVSGGFIYFAENFRKRLGMDYAFANELEFEGDVLTGRLKGEIINAQKKASLLDELAKREGIHLEQVVAVGDGANDLPMLARAGLGIAFHAKEKVRKEARHQMSHGPMTTLLYFLGIPGDHLK